jgi:hypothetical protein
MKRFFPWIALIVALLIVAFVVRQCCDGGAENYQIAVVTRGPITQAVTATGTLILTADYTDGTDSTTNEHQWTLMRGNSCLFVSISG